MTEEQETTKVCDCGRTIYLDELCICKQDKSNSPFQTDPYSKWCPECNGSGYTTTNNINQVCLNQIHNL